MWWNNIKEKQAREIKRLNDELDYYREKAHQKEIEGIVKKYEDRMESWIKESIDLKTEILHLKLELRDIHHPFKYAIDEEHSKVVIIRKEFRENDTKYYTVFNKLNNKLLEGISEEDLDELIKNNK